MTGIILSALSMVIRNVLLLDCLQPLYFSMHTKEKASKANTKKMDRGGEVIELGQT